MPLQAAIPWLLGAGAGLGAIDVAGKGASFLDKRTDSDILGGKRRSRKTAGVLLEASALEGLSELDDYFEQASLSRALDVTPRMTFGGLSGLEPDREAFVQELVARKRESIAAASRPRVVDYTEIALSLGEEL